MPDPAPLPEQIDTERLRLRPPRLEDADWIHEAYARDPDFTRYLTWRPHRDPARTLAFVAQAIDDFDGAARRLWILERREDGTPLGNVDVRIEGFMATLGYSLAPAHQGQGYMTEAAGAVARMLIGRPEIHRVWAVTDPENRASQRVLERIGMQREGRLRRWTLRPNLSHIPRDSICYSLVE